MRKLACLGVMLVVGAGMAPGAHAAVVPSTADFDATFSTALGLSPAAITFDTTTGMFTADNAAFGSPTIPAFFLDDTGFAAPVASDFIGAFTLTAAIDGLGMLSSGSFSLSGGSATLGIAPGTTVLAGTLTALDTAPSAFRFLGETLATAPALESVVGPIDEVLLTIISGRAGQPNPFAVSFNELTPTSSPDISGRPLRVTEPSSAALMAFGVIALIGVTVRRRRIRGRACSHKGSRLTASAPRRRFAGPGNPDAPR